MNAKTLQVLGTQAFTSNDTPRASFDLWSPIFVFILSFHHPPLGDKKKAPDRGFLRRRNEARH